VPRLLQAPEHHDLHQASDVQRRRGGVKANIGRNDLRSGQRIQPLSVGDLVDITPVLEEAQEIRLVLSVHSAARLAWRFALG
jgi:hypothetical protein